VGKKPKINFDFPTNLVPFEPDRFVYIDNPDKLA